MWVLGEKVTLERVCAEPMYKYLLSLSKSENPFLENLEKVKLSQARIYVGGDVYIAEGIIPPHFYRPVGPVNPQPEQ